MSDVWNVTTGRSLVGTTPVQNRTQEKRIPGGSAFNGLWPGDRENDPGWYSSLESDFKKCKNLKILRGKIWRCGHGPSAGPLRVCDISGTAFTHDYHLEQIAKSLIESRGCEPFTSENDDDYPKAGSFRDFFIISLFK